MAHYKARSQLFLTDTREQAGEAAVQRWAELTKTRDIREVALITDASNVEVDRLNARAQHLRAERGELGQAEVPLPHKHYGLREGDRIVFTAQHRPPGQPRVENGARGQVTDIHDDRGVTVTLDVSERRVTLAGEDLESLRLGYAQHIYRQQGATVERTVVVTGGWQTSRETAYVEASRARNGTEFYVNREELDLAGQDERLRRAGSPRRCEPAAHRHPRSRTASSPTRRGTSATSTRSTATAASPPTSPGPSPQTRARPITGILTMSRKLQIVLPDPVWAQLQELAAGAGEPLPPSPARSCETASRSRPRAARSERPGHADCGRQGERPTTVARALRRRPRLAPGDVGSGRRAARPLPSPAPGRQKRLVDRRVTDRDALRAGRMASRNRRRRPGPPRRARLPHQLDRLRPRAAPARRQHHPGMETRPTARGVDGTVGHSACRYDRSRG